MKLIVGLGNPGKEYERTRHNVGFWAIDTLAERWSVTLSKKKFSARFGSGSIASGSVTLLKPQTYMNRSGQSVSQAAQFYQLVPEQIMVIVDEMALPLGQLRLRGKGSAGGHNGLKDIIAALGRDDFPRLRIGIGAPKYGDATDHVLGAFASEERDEAIAAVGRCADAVECWLRDGLEACMNEYNRRVDESES